MTTSSAPPEGSLRDRGWERFLSAPDPRLVQELYEPALSVAERYDRCCAYFSSSVLAAAARGFGPFIERLLAMGGAAPKPAIRLLVNEELQEQDVRALEEKGDHSALEALLTERLGEATTALERSRLEMLSWLYERGYLDIKVGIMRQSYGILHAKFGVVTDWRGDAIVFNGSGNESASGLRGNYEQLEISTSWDDPERHRHYTDEFEQLWKGHHPDVKVYTLPEAVREKLVKYAPKETPVGVAEASSHRDLLESAMVWQFVAAAPYLSGPSGLAACDSTAFVSPWPHQRRVVDETAAAWPDGRLLCDEVGMGKTIEAILVLRRLLHGRGVRRALLLLPAGLLQQWQEELREKGGLIVPRYEQGRLIWPDGTTRTVSGLGDALEEPLVIVSRELARGAANAELLLAATPWDLVLVDESHAARRAQQEETEFNSATLLLRLMRELQLRGRTRSFMLLSATPMQTQPWEPFDLLQVLGEGGEWLADFGGIRKYYNAASALTHGNECKPDDAIETARLVVCDGRFVPPPSKPDLLVTDRSSVASALDWALPDERPVFGRWLKAEAPLARRMHRNTRSTLREYYQRGLISQPPPHRDVDDVHFDYTYPKERDAYDRIEAYINRRFEELEKEKPGKGFVMTIYRRRASSSPLALRRSLERRRDGLQAVITGVPTEQSIGLQDLASTESSDLEADDEFASQVDIRVQVSRALPDDPAVAALELEDVEELLQLLDSIPGDSKRDCFLEVHNSLTADGRPVLVFTEAYDTLEYLRDYMLAAYGSRLATYSGQGGQRWVEGQWQSLTKQQVAELLAAGELSAVICTDAASEGLNLQTAGAIINYDLPWNPSRVEQRIGRIDRIGQRYPYVYVRNLFLTDSIDDRVYQVLQERCGLFRQFVGEMQPVLAEARRALLGVAQGSVDDIVNALRARADTVSSDPLAEAIYEDEAVSELEAVAPALTTAQLRQCLLDFNFGQFQTEAADSGVIHVKSNERIHRFASDERTLSSDTNLEPLGPAHTVIQTLAAIGRAEGPLLPLVVEFSEADGFRVAHTAWVHPDGRGEPVTTLEQLLGLIKAWDGTSPERSVREEYRRDLAAAAEGDVRASFDSSEHRWRAGLRAQVVAAQRRLEREVARYLIARDSFLQCPASHDLNLALHAAMTRPGPASPRLKKAFDRLGGYPDWDSLVVETVYNAVSGLNASKIQSLLSLTSVDAALADPRWLAQTTPDIREV